MFVILVCFASCNPIAVFQTEIIEFTVTSDMYVLNDIQIENPEIQADREIEVYWRPSASSLWQFVIDVEIYFGDGLMLITDASRLYENNIIRIIVSWFDEGPQ